MGNRTSQYEFTIVVPVFNEQESLPELEKALSGFLPKCTKKACVLFVNDGSSDGSLKGIQEICGRNKDFCYISFAKNAGLSAAIKAGIDYTESKYLGYMDADLQTTPEDFNLLLADIDSYSMVIGIRAERKDSFHKRAQSKIANSFRRMMTGDGAADTGCPLKVLRTDAAKRLPLFKGLHRFLPALILLQDGGSYKQVPVRHFPRQAGKSKFSLLNRLWGPFADCFAYRWMRTRYINYTVSENNLNS
ncbi:MAG: glycosyltransferase [Candidatus Cryptobacteroides sp.]